MWKAWEVLQKGEMIVAVLAKEKVDIIFLQETHQAKECVNQVKLNWSGVYEKA